MYEDVFRAEKLLAAEVADLEVGVLTGDDATALLRTFIHIERLAVAGRTRLARRIDESNVWRRTGHKSAASFLAQQSGESLGQAFALLNTAEHLTSLPETAEAFTRGELSLTQTKEIASAAAANPGAEPRLLNQARHQPLHQLKEACRAVKNQAASQEEDRARYRRIHQSRYWREWTEGGAVHGQYLLTPEVGAAVHNQIKTIADQFFQQARAAGRHEPPQAYAADALAHLLTGGAGYPAPSATTAPAVNGRASTHTTKRAPAVDGDDPAPADADETQHPAPINAGTPGHDLLGAYRVAEDAGDNLTAGAKPLGDLAALLGYPFPIDPGRANDAPVTKPPGAKCQPGAEVDTCIQDGTTGPPTTDTGPPDVAYPSPGPRAVVHLRVDYQVLKRGHVEDGEVCEIVGVGAVPAATAAWLAQDCWLKVLVTDGEDIRAVAHAGRTIPSRLRTALEERDRECVIPGCAVRKGLEIHHYPDYRDGTPASLATCCRVCQWHHYLITYCGYCLEGQVGDWRWIVPTASQDCEDSDDHLALHENHQDRHALRPGDRRPPALASLREMTGPRTGCSAIII